MLLVLSIPRGFEKNNIAPIYNLDSQVFAEPSSERVMISFGSLIDNRKNVNPASVAIVFGLITLRMLFFHDIPLLYVNTTYSYSPHDNS